ncbi:MAG: putative sulfate exporter family transporter [Pseudoflavonifractor sp.]|nr:putative sulfate exporter family transporter [Alloprevotella sp.]MCM1116549.1 putative sulfate exporter family transporter [Pseudoflavonifractor sp.]
MPVKKALYYILCLIVLLPGSLLGFQEVTPPLALLIGLIFAFAVGCPAPKFNKKASKYLLQASVVGLGFGMNLIESLRSGAEGMTFTVISVIGVMVIGVALARWMAIDRKTGYLISSGTAICGGSAIAAVGPVIKANENQMAVSLGVIFILNSIALFIFPALGHLAGMSQEQFGTWAAIAIHDTSSVVGAGEAYGQQALQMATLIKLTRALWIIPLALVTLFFFRDKSGSGKISIPWFIFLFVAAMAINTYCPLPEALTHALVIAAKRGMVLTLFLIGCSLSLKTIKSVGFKPMIQAIVLWVMIGATSFAVVMATID